VRSLPDVPRDDDEPLAWRNRLALLLLRAFVVVFSISLAIVFVAMNGARERFLLMCVLAAALVAVSVPALTGRPSGTARAWIVIVPSTILAIAGYAFAGFLSGPGIVMMMTLMLAGLLLGRRVMIGATLVCLGAVSLTAWAMVHGHLPAPPANDHDMTRGLPWLRSLSVSFFAISIFGGLVTAVVTRMERSLLLARQETRLRERAERAALESQQLELVGRLAAGIAHDFNNNLTAIMGCAELLRMELPERASSRELADNILHSSERLAELTRQLLAYSRKANMRKTSMDLNTVVAEAVSLVRRSASPNVQVVTKYSAANPTVVADVALLGSAILNLLVNASDAMPAGGVLTIATTSVDLAADAAAAKGLPPGGFALFEVLDTGHGIPGELLPHIFDPFVTTKPVGHGTGLGLAAVAGTIKAHGGWIDVESEVGIGTAFRVYLPAAETGPRSALSGTDEIVRGDGEVLLVDDDLLVSLTATATLRSLGYRVTHAVSGERALELVRSEPDRFDLVLLDLRMPGLSGEATFSALRAIAADLKILIWSGYGAEQDVAGMLAQGAAGFVQKPYRVFDLSRAIADALRPS
jgi:signal transduction histidine kinase